jgi:ssDNA-binding replication factor A large subunit
MEIQLKVIKENPDGSADAVVTFNKEGMEFLIQEGMISILKRYIEEEKNERKSKSSGRKSLRTKADTDVGLHSGKQHRVSRGKRN